MPNTPRWQIPYPGPNDAPNGYSEIQDVADGTEAALNKLCRFFTNVTLSSTGLATVTHGLGWTPRAVVVTPSSPIGGGAGALIFAMAMTDQFTLTTFRIKGLHADGSYVVGNVNFSAMFGQ